MISFFGLGRLGRLGNQLFQIASIKGIATKLDTTCHFPQWHYSKYFKNKLPRIGRRFQTHYEPQFHHSEHWLIDNKDYHGWLQSEKYFDSSVKETFEFDTTFKDLVTAKYAKFFNKETIAISVRRGDFVGNPNYELIPATYYIGALLKFDYKKYNIIFFSDDISYCKTHFECLPNAYFCDGSDIEQLCCMTMCENHIISSSTFSWWGAYLSQSKRIIRPAYNFSAEYLLRFDDKDYYPERWEVFDHKGYKIPLDCTFIIPVTYDHIDRLENLTLNIDFLKDFDTKIIIGENKTRKMNADIHFDFEYFHRTKMLNELAKKGTEIIVNWDADVICPPMQLIAAVDAIKSGYDMIYPYDGRLARVGRKWYSELLRFLDVGILSKYEFAGTRDHDERSVGGAVLFNKESFFKGGGENENMISYAPEDRERFYRFDKLGFKIARIKGMIYHVDHYIGLDSSDANSFFDKNKEHFEIIKSLTTEQLKEYVSNNNTLSKS